MGQFAKMTKCATVLELMIVIHGPHVKKRYLDHTLVHAIQDTMALVNGVMISMSVKMILATLTPHALIVKDHLNVLV